MRAWTNEFIHVMDGYLHSSSEILRAHFLKYKTPDAIINQFILRQKTGMGAMKDWWAELTQDNKRRVYRAVYDWMTKNDFFEPISDAG